MVVNRRPSLPVSNSLHGAQIDCVFLGQEFLFFRNFFTKYCFEMQTFLHDISIDDLPSALLIPVESKDLDLSPSVRFLASIPSSDSLQIQKIQR